MNNSKGRNMAEQEPISRIEVVNMLLELKEEIRDPIRKDIADLKDALAKGRAEDLQKYDNRYVQASRSTQDALSRISDDKFAVACFPIVSKYLDTGDGKTKVTTIMDEHICSKRDSATKWIDFGKALGVIVVMALMFYNQMAVLSNQKTVLSNQKQIEAKQTNLNTQINRIEGASHE